MTYGTRYALAKQSTAVVKITTWYTAIKRGKNLRDNSGIKVPIFSLEKTSLEPCKCNTNFQIYLLSSIYSQCLILIGLDKVVHGPQNVFLGNWWKPCTINPSSSIIQKKTGTLNNCKNNWFLLIKPTKLWNDITSSVIINHS